MDFNAAGHARIAQAFPEQVVLNILQDRYLLDFRITEPDLPIDVPTVYRQIHIPIDSGTDEKRAMAGIVFRQVCPAATPA